MIPNRNTSMTATMKIGFPEKILVHVYATKTGVSRCPAHHGSGFYLKAVY